MAKQASKSASKRSSSSKNRTRRRRSGGPETDPPIIIKGGALGAPADETYSMQMECRSPMDFSFVPSVARPFQYFYPSANLGEITEVSIVKDGTVVFNDKLAGSVWQVVLTAE